jgi:ATP-dependent RNA helicase DDX19/DBP5
MPESAAGGGSLADRITKPEEKTSWADEVASPVNENPPTTISNGKEPEQPTVDNAQVDGATEPFGGSDLQEPEFDVEIKLADMQANPNNPLYSVTTFEQLGL